MGMADLHAWSKAVHIIAVISWMAALLYLPRLFAYHSESAAGSTASEQFKFMEYRLARLIMMPAAIAVWIFGLGTAWLSGDLLRMPRWLFAKLFFVVILSAFHIVLEKHLRELRSDSRRRSVRYFKSINEIPTLLMIIIVVLVVVKPI
jgi:protoporphyrinogen IX oxidase